ncbi:unnamed protein product [Closterium sp. NIES-65]|nr:unnamed protein product [Closterium sp. NIES-65]
MARASGASVNASGASEAARSAATETASADESNQRPLLGRVLEPPPADVHLWDSQCFSGPVVVAPVQALHRESASQGEPGSLPDSPDPGVQVDGSAVGDPGLWRMYYYGRDGDYWAKGVKALPVPIGRVGLAVSRDGVTWQRVRGPLPGGAVLDPAESDEAFDSVHVAVGDVLRAWNPEHVSGDDSDFGDDDSACAIDDPASCASDAGAEIQIGAAWSWDGVHFNVRTEKPVLEKGAAGEWDQFGVSWPRVVLLSQASPPAAAGDSDAESGSRSGNLVTADPSVTGDTWLMTYHTRGQDEQGKAGYAAGAAVSRDGGETWQRLGKVLSGGGPGSWDEQGVSVRSVVSVPAGKAGRSIDGLAADAAEAAAAGTIGSAADASGKVEIHAACTRLIMLYEGCNTSNEFAIGLATSDDDGLTWHKAIGAGPEPGGPVLKARRGEDPWDNILVGAPYVVARPDGSLWMYYVGVGKMQGDETPRQGIGLAVSCGSDYSRWERYGITGEFES